MRLSYQNMCGTQKTRVLITLYPAKSTKKPHNTNEVQNIALVSIICVDTLVIYCPYTPLNISTVLISNCHHKNKFLLVNVEKYLLLHGF